MRMLSKDQIKEYIEQAETDILFEKFISLLDNEADIIYEPQGLFNKEIQNDIGRVTKKKGNIHIAINRPGFYDILPLGLFHNKMDEINNQPQYVEQVDAEKRTFRNLFLPFDSELFSTSASIERECNNHFKFTFDSEISISLMRFFRIFDELGLLSIYETLLVDCIYAEKNKNNVSDSCALVNLIFQDHYSPYALMVRMLDLAESDAKLKRFLNVLASATGDVGRIQAIEKALSYIFNKEFRLHIGSNRKKYYSHHRTNRIGGTSLNANANSLIIGDFFEEEQEAIEVEIVYDSENAVFQRQYIDGCFNDLLRLILSFFLPCETEFQIRFAFRHSKQNSGSHPFRLAPGYGKGFEELGFRRQEIQKIFESISPYQDSFHTRLDEDSRFRVKEYFTRYLAESLGAVTDYTFLSMNTKI